MLLCRAPSGASIRAKSFAFGCVLALSAACDRSAPPSKSDTKTETATVASPPDDGSPKKTRAGDLEVLEVLTGDAKATDALPMIVAVHGLGDKPENWLEFFATFPIPARVILPRAPEPWGDGGSWFHYPPSSEADLADGVAKAGDRVAAAIAELEKTRPTKGLALLTGFSQGGFVSYAVAVRHPEVIAAAFPMSGALPLALEPSEADAKKAAPIFAVHGDHDPIVPIQMDRDGAKRLEALGAHVVLQEFPRISHTVTPAMRAAVTEKIVALAEGQARSW